ncbi:nuclease-related domain-containing protein [Aquibacillus sediminis]|uniref:nuclease-related domain-containing protein n=1 Tax=Aquibacillus sediminis TaxID=2574734 RepID=UPI001108032D|nr:nuclease-related domain-containing protein [Aquibacillus sediminis]
MISKIRKKSKELIILESLNDRMSLPSKDKQHFHSLKKGYEGEVKFDTLTEKLQCDCIILNDLLLEINNTTFQIDTLIIFQEHVHLYEVKNYDGEYFFEQEKLYKKPNLEIINPLHQLSRSESLLRQLLLSLGFNPQINGSVVFINPNFNLYQSPLDQPILFQNQVKKHLGTLSVQPFKLTAKHKNLARKLASMHITNPKFEKLPTYDYDELRKGITCLKCHSFFVLVGKNSCSCENCGFIEPSTNAIKRSIEEFRILFPNKKITTKIIQDWCRVNSERKIRAVLLKNYSKIGEHRWTYYK